ELARSKRSSDPNPFSLPPNPLFLVDESPRGQPSPSSPPPAAGGGVSDAELGALLRSGSREAAAAVYDRFSTQVNRWVWRLLGADHEHNDIVQQVFVRILQFGPRLRETDKLTGWVHAITVNTVHGELRRRQSGASSCATTLPRSCTVTSCARWRCAICWCAPRA